MFHVVQHSQGVLQRRLPGLLFDSVSHFVQTTLSLMVGFGKQAELHQPGLVQAAHSDPPQTNVQPPRRQPFREHLGRRLPDLLRDVRAWIEAGDRNICRGHRGGLGKSVSRDDGSPLEKGSPWERSGAYHDGEAQGANPLHAGRKRAVLRNGGRSRTCVFSTLKSGAGRR